MFMPFAAQATTLASAPRTRQRCDPSNSEGDLLGRRGLLRTESSNPSIADALITKDLRKSNLKA